VWQQAAALLLPAEAPAVLSPRAATNDSAPDLELHHRHHLLLLLLLPQSVLLQLLPHHSGASWGASLAQKLQALLTKTLSGPHSCLMALLLLPPHSHAALR
jgi:hypothetical protein